MSAAKGRFTGNGWPVLTSATTGALPRLRKFQVPGIDRYYLLRDGCIGFVLMHFIVWWHKKIERLDLGTWDEWGFADRANRNNPNENSEHAGGDAADINSTQHPNGVPISRTFTDKQITSIRRRLRLYLGILHWGGDFHSTVDGMHVQVEGVGITKVNRLAKALMLTPTGKAILAANPGLKEVINS